MLIKVSIGEVIDKLSILQIKLERIKDPSKLLNINNEYSTLISALEQESITVPEEFTDLISINSRIWDSEEEIRRLTSKQEAWDFLLITSVSKRIHELNDERAIIKKLINSKFKSEIVEEKSYEGM